jgi:aromatic-L-amino-acid/L-tryptophan decarboxylase
MQTNKAHTTRQNSTTENSLDSDWEEFGKDLQSASEVVIRLYRELPNTRITSAKSRMEIASLFDEALPEAPQPMDAILEQVEKNIFANSTLYVSPRFFGYINGCSNQAAMIGELLASAVNQICAKWHFSPAASEVERRVIRWIAAFIGFSPEAEGCLLSGGSAGNLVGLAAARKHKAQFDAASLGMGGGPSVTVYVSEEGHASLEKCMDLLGMGRNHLRKIPVRDDFTIDVVKLAKRVAEDRYRGVQPICVVGNAGTTNTGAVDPLNVLADFCGEQGLWFHVDAAYGGPAAQTDIARRLFLGLDRADSVVINPHKWLYVPVEASCILVRKPKALPETFQVAADYLDERDKEDGAREGAIDFKDYGPQLSRSFRALKVWMTFKAYGAEKLRAAIAANIEIMRYLADRIDESQDFVRLAPVPLSVVCFQYRTTDTSIHADQKYLNELNARLLDGLEKDGRLFLSGTKINGRSALRACSVNHRLRSGHIDFLLEAIREVGSTVLKTMKSRPAN